MMDGRWPLHTTECPQNRDFLCVWLTFKCPSVVVVFLSPVVIDKTGTWLLWWIRAFWNHQAWSVMEYLDAWKSMIITESVHENIPLRIRVVTAFGGQLDAQLRPHLTYTMLLRCFVIKPERSMLLVISWKCLHEIWSQAPHSSSANMQTTHASNS